MIRISSALTSLARDPFPFLLTVLSCRFLQLHGWGWLATLVAAGFCVSVFEQALRSDLAPPPRSKDLPRTAYLGCMGGCGLWFAVAMSVLAMSISLACCGLEKCSPLAEWRYPPAQASLALVLAWLTQSLFVALYLAWVRTDLSDRSRPMFNGFFSYFGAFLKRPPINGAGVRLLLLLLLFAICQPWLFTAEQTIVQYSSLLFASLYAHCLGQCVRKGYGFKLS